MKNTILLLTFLLSINLPAHANDNMPAVIKIINDFLLETGDFAAPKPVEYPCEVPYNQPSPGFEVKGSCGAHGLKKLELMKTMGAFTLNSSRMTQDMACKAKANYQFCGFQETDHISSCNEIERFKRNIGYNPNDVVVCD